MIKRRKVLQLGSSIALFLYTYGVKAVEGSSIPVRVDISSKTGYQVSSLLTGLNFVYTHEDTRTWADGRKTKALVDANIRIIRYPGGGQVSFWDWEFPYHGPYTNFMDPEYQKSLTEEKKDELKETNKHIMLIENYFSICRKANIEPLMGINMTQGWKYNKTKESIEKAVRLVEYCKRQTPKVKYYYLDNEIREKQQAKKRWITPDDYLKLIPQYAKAIKAVDPDAKLIANIFKPESKIEDLIRECGDYIDIYDDHWYYATDNRWAYFVIDKWRVEKEPEHKTHLFDNIEKWKKKYKKPHIKLGILEWNYTPVMPNTKWTANIKDDSERSYLYQCLVSSDMLMQMMNHNAFMAAAWPIMWKSREKYDNYYDRNFFHQTTGKVNPVHNVFRWFSMAEGGTMLQTTYDLETGLRGVVVKKKDNKSLILFLLNKSTKAIKADLRLPWTFTKYASRTLTGGKNPNEVKVEKLFVNVKGKKVEIELKSDSLSVMELRM